VTNFIKERAKVSKNDRISVILFDSAARTLYTNKPISEKITLPDLR
jgi:hypothetical protein